MKGYIIRTVQRERSWATPRRRVYKYDRPEYPSRVFLDFGETVREHLENRRSRPWQELKPVVKELLEERSVPVDKLSWNINAGCGMCPCSGGFLVDGEWGKDYYVKVEADA